MVFDMSFPFVVLICLVSGVSLYALFSWLTRKWRVSLVLIFAVLVIGSVWVLLHVDTIASLLRIATGFAGS